jgi:hypothetical protein
MHKRSSKGKLPRDVNQLARPIVDQATDSGPTAASTDINSHAQGQDAAKQAAAILGRLGGLKGGHARAKKLGKKRRSEIAAKAAAARWSKKSSR